MKNLIFILMFSIVSFGMIGCSSGSVGSDGKKLEDGNALVDVTVNWNEVSNVPEERFAGQYGNDIQSKLKAPDSTVTHFGIRIEYLSDDAVFTQSVSNSAGDSTGLITLDIPTADSVAIYAVAVNYAGQNGVPDYVINMGVIKQQVLNQAINYNFTVSDFKWQAPSWGVGPDFEPTGWNTARVDSALSQTRIEFNVVNPFDKPNKDINSSNFIIGLNGVGGVSEYKGNDIREYYVLVEKPSNGSSITTEWYPYLDGSQFNLPGERYVVDKRGVFDVYWE